MKNNAPMSLNQLKKPSSAAQQNQAPTQAQSSTLTVSLYPVDDIQFLLTHGPDMISRELRAGKLWEQATIQILQNFLLNIEKPIFIDIGANLGAITIPIGKFIQLKQGKVISFEAQRGVFYQLCGNIFANKLINTCTAHNIAIGDHESEIDIPVLDLNKEKNVGSLSLDENIRKQQNTLSTQITEFEKVQLKPINSVKLPHAHLIKIDVEGLELEVLQGAQQYIRDSHYPPLFFEVWGDYMKDLIPKREALMSFVKITLGYEIVLFGELCIAQHPSNQYFKIEIGDQRSLSMARLK